MHDLRTAQEVPDKQSLQMCLAPPALPPSLPGWKTPRIRRLKSSEGVHQGITIAACERCERCDLRKAAKRFLTIAEGERCCGKRSTNLTTKVLEGLFTSLTSLKSQISKQVSRRQMIFQALFYNSRCGRDAPFLGPRLLTAVAAI